MEIEQEKIKAAFDAAKDNEQLTNILVALFGEQKLVSKPITERVKTFYDAMNVLPEFHDYVTAYHNFIGYCYDEERCENDILAFLKLRIITAALNEGWEPTFSDGEKRWYPYFYLNCGGVSFAYALYTTKSANMYSGSRLAFKSEELAEYAGKQFLDIYSELIGIELTENKTEQ